MLAEMSNQNLPTLGIIGMGYVGLPLAVVFAEAGVRVIGFDVSDEKISFLSKISRQAVWYHWSKQG